MKDSSRGAEGSALDAFTRLLVCNDQDMKWFTAANSNRLEAWCGLAFS